MKATRILLFLPVFVMCLEAVGYPAPFDPPESRMNDIDGNSRCLDLTHEQIHKMTSLREWYEKEVTPLRIMQFERKSEMRLLWMQMKPDPKQVEAKHREILDIEWRIQLKTIEYWLKFRDILTQEQLSQFLMISGGRDFRPPRPDRPARKLFPHRPPRKGF